MGNFDTAIQQALDDHQAMERDAQALRTLGRLSVGWRSGDWINFGRRVDDANGDISAVVTRLRQEVSIRLQGAAAGNQYMP